jgi:hypothetical protein
MFQYGLVLVQRIDKLHCTVIHTPEACQGRHIQGKKDVADELQGEKVQPSRRVAR